MEIFAAHFNTTKQKQTNYNTTKQTNKKTK